MHKCTVEYCVSLLDNIPVFRDLRSILCMLLYYGNMGRKLKMILYHSYWKLRFEWCLCMIGKWSKVIACRRSAENSPLVWAKTINRSQIFQFSRGASAVHTMATKQNLLTIGIIVLCCFRGCFSVIPGKCLSKDPSFFSSRKVKDETMLFFHLKWRKKTRASGMSRAKNLFIQLWTWSPTCIALIISSSFLEMVS